MREINITTTTARSASGAYIKPDMKVWAAKEADPNTKPIARRTLAVSPELETLERLFPTAHVDMRHTIDRKTGLCWSDNCWRNTAHE